MLDYTVAFVNRTGVFPDILAVNASGPSATDGTEFIANMINDSMWGVWQMILNRAGLTPNGVLESDSASQIKEALQKGFGAPVGVVTQWHLDDDPGTTGHRGLLLNGQGILRANYTELDAAVYVGDANNAAVAAAGGGYYRADDAAGTIPNIVGIYLILPETRGYVPRGLDVAASVDPDGASRYLGDNQVDAFQKHAHGLDKYSGNAGVAWSNVNWPAAADGGGSGIGNATADETNNVTVVSPIADGGGTPRTSSESRMTNFASKFVIWY